MKKLFLIMLVLLSVVAQAQITIVNPGEGNTEQPVCDKMKYVVNYDMTYMNDTTKNEPQTEMMQLEIGERCTKFYSHEKMQKDSVIRERVKQGNYDFKGLSGGKIGWELYKGHPKDGHTAWLQTVGLNKFMVVEPVAMPDWKLVSDSVATILGYKCQQATANYKGRRWTVWYAEDIPIAEGPWLLAGLPGLVLRACDAQGHYVFEAKGMRQAKEGLTITYSGSKHEEISRKEFNQEMKRYRDDVIGYIKNDPRITGFKINDKTGEAVQKLKRPYNPIERE
ncbi:MAG: GLPGLI family protein [Prevotella sp.]|nr:GLPGLI family protein [Prevotella sp.]